MVQVFLILLLLLALVMAALGVRYCSVQNFPCIGDTGAKSDDLLSLPSNHLDDLYNS